ncbi:MAG: SprT family zinc-dependent metalloprotease [Fibrobacterota bacterium]
MPKRFWNWLKASRPVETRHIEVSGIPIEMVRKAIRNFHLRVSPPDGRVRVSAPFRMSHGAIRLAVEEKLAWIKRHRARFEGLPRQIKRELVNGENHFFLGQPYCLQITEHTGNPRVVVNGTNLDIRIRPGSSIKQRERVLLEWYRRQLKARVPPLLKKWEAAMGVRTAGWNIKKMKTKWGTCNVSTRRIWLNLELAKRPVECLENIIVHELAHLIERNHGPRFTALMDRYLPHWKQQRDMLDQQPIGSSEELKRLNTGKS